MGRAAQALYDQMLVATPGVLPAVQGRMGAVPAWSSRTVTGKQHKSADSDTVLTTGDDGVMLTGGPGKHVTVRYDSVAALLRWNDGRQALVGDDGFVVQLDPDEWAGGRAVPDSVVARVRPDVVIDLTEPGPRAPAVERPARRKTRASRAPGASPPLPVDGVCGGSRPDRDAIRALEKIIPPPRARCER